jgi:hypothetical protein
MAFLNIGFQWAGGIGLRFGTKGVNKILEAPNGPETSKHFPFRRGQLWITGAHYRYLNHDCQAAFANWHAPSGGRQGWRVVGGCTRCQYQPISSRGSNLGHQFMIPMPQGCHRSAVAMLGEHGALVVRGAAAAACPTTAGLRAVRRGRQSTTVRPWTPTHHSEAVGAKAPQ